MNRLSKLLTGAGLGAGLMYFFDPVLGNRRRSLLRDQLTHAIVKANRGADATLRDIEHRVYGTFAELRSCFAGDEEVSDEVLVSRVRSKMGRYSSHPAAIEVAAHHGVITLRGPILTHEVGDLLCAVRSVRGVEAVVDELDVHDSAGNLSALQGGSHRRGEPTGLMQSNWSPATRVAAGVAGGMLMLNCLARRTMFSPLLGTAGFGLMLRALTNLETKRLLGISGRRGIDIHKTIVINRPVEEVFLVLSDPESYPLFTDLVISVRDLGDGCYAKTFAGPAGTEIKIHETITRLVANEFVAFRSEPDSPIQFAGRARFVALDASTTKIEIDATYNPPGGILTHAAARIMGLDLKSLVDDIMMRAKSYLESGIEPHDAARHRGNGRDKQRNEWRGKYPKAGEAAVMRQSWRVTQ